MGVTLSVQTVFVKRRFPTHEAKGRADFQLSRIIRPGASLFFHLRDTNPQEWNNYNICVTVSFNMP
jgi:hypothetical protein